MTKRNTKVLLVDDDALNQLVTGLMLRRQGIDVTIANNGVEALTEINSKCFQLVLMDIQMPIMDGFEATSRIRAMPDPYFKMVPIVALTASGIIEAQSMAVEKGMNDFISKPLDEEEFQTTLDKYLRMLRPLYIDFFQYTDGDPIFKKEFITLLISNLRELQASVMNYTHDTSKKFSTVLHKVAATISMLNDSELSAKLEEIKLLSVSGSNGEFLQGKLKAFSQLCDRVVESLMAA